MSLVTGDFAAWLVRTALLAGLLITAGGIVMGGPVVAALRRASDPLAAIGSECRRRADRVVRWALVALAPIVMLRLLQQAAAVAESPTRWSGAVPVVLRTIWGRAWMIQAAVLVLAAIAAPLTARRESERPRWVLAALVGVLSITPALAGHAVGSPHVPALAVVADAVHMLAAGAWLGTLAMVLAVGLPVCARGDAAVGAAALARLVAAFSPIALSAAAALGVTGTFASWLHLDEPASLWRTRYGQLLLLKLAAAGAAVAVGAWNWRRVTPRLGAAAGARALRRSATAELAAGAVVVAVTAALVATPLPGE